MQAVIDNDETAGSEYSLMSKDHVERDHKKRERGRSAKCQTKVALGHKQ